MVKNKCIARFNRHFDHVKAVAVDSTKRRQALLESSTDAQIRCICECVYNVINGKVPFDEEEKSKLLPYRDVMTKLLDRNEKRTKKFWRKKKRLLVQKGGFLPLILGPLLGVAGSLLTDLITRR
jgi:hypothetical protein